MIMDFVVDICLHVVRIVKDPQDLVKAITKVP